MNYKDEYTGQYWEEGMFSLKPEEVLALKETNVRDLSWLEDFARAYVAGEFFWAGGDPRRQHHINNKINGFFFKEDRKKKGKLYEISHLSNQLRFVVFDEHPQNPGLQVIRIMEGFEFPEDRRVKEYYRLQEISRWVLDPAKKTWMSIKMPDSRFNPSDVCYPFIGTNNKYAIKLGGYQGSATVGNLDETLFWTKHVVPGITLPVGFLGLLFSTSKLPEKDKWGYEYSRHYRMGSGDFDIFFEGSLLVKLMTKCPWIISKFYGESSDTSFYWTLTKDYDKVINKLDSGWRPGSIEELKEYDRN